MESMYLAKSYMRPLGGKWPAGSLAASSLLPRPSNYNSFYRCLGSSSGGVYTSDSFYRCLGSSGSGGGVYTSESPAAISFGSGGGLADQLLQKTKVSPWLLIPPPDSASAGNIFGSKRSSFYDYYYSLAENRVKSIEAESCCSMRNAEEDPVCIGSSHGWLYFVNQRNHSAFLFNPITQRRIELPSLRTLPVPDSFHPRNCGSIHALSSPPEAAAEDCRLMISYYSTEASGKKLAFCCPGRGEKIWTCLPSSLKHYNCTAYSSRNRMFVTLNEDFEMECWDLSDPLSPKRTRRINDLRVDELVYPSRPAFASVTDQAEEEELFRKADSHDSHYLVPIPYADDDCEFFWVVRYVTCYVNPEDNSAVDQADENASGLPYKTWTFDVYKFDLTEGVMWYMDHSLEDHVIFVGLNDSFLLSAMDFPELKPNSIYFTDDFLAYSRESKDQPYGGHDVGIYNYKDETFEDCYYPWDYRSIKRIEPYPIWFIPNPL